MGMPHYFARSRVDTWRRSRPLVRLGCTLWLLALCTSSAMAAVAESAVADTPEQAAGVAQATAALDRWHGDRTELASAKTELDAVLAANPRSAPAYREYARYYIISAYVSGETYDPEGLALAERALDRAIALAPDYAEAFVLRGSLYTTLERRADARAALIRAEALGTQDPWLDINWGVLLQDEGKTQEGLDRCGRAVARAPTGGKILSGIDECRIRAYGRLGRLDDVDATYRKQIDRVPDEAWPRGNYASFLLCVRDQPDKAVDAATAALQRMDYGIGRSTLAAALYASWSKQVLAGDAGKAAAAWRRASSTGQTDPVALIETACNSRRPALAILRALRDTGRADAIPAVAAVLLAAETPSHAKTGLFVLPVVGSGRSAPYVYLNSESDYRDQRTLTVRFTPEAVIAYRSQHGADPDVALKGKRITVIGVAARVKVFFIANGKPTDKYYYQTQVEVSEPWQVEVETQRPQPADEQHDVAV